MDSIKIRLEEVLLLTQFFFAMNTYFSILTTAGLF